jgi:hypothetical protein
MRGNGRLDLSRYPIIVFTAFYQSRNDILNVMTALIRPRLSQTQIYPAQLILRET